jgi:thioredoxin-like negative regulator of GroEL
MGAHEPDRPGAAGQDGWDFFVSYASADRGWAEWIAWQLEEVGYRVLLQAWDFVPGTSWISRMEEAVRTASRTVAVLSHDYLASVYGQAEWQAAYRRDPAGLTRTIIPIRVQDCPRPTLLDAVVSFDLFDLPADQARSQLLAGIQAALRGRAKPDAEPPFPVNATPRMRPEPAPNPSERAPAPRAPNRSAGHAEVNHLLTRALEDLAVEVERQWSQEAWQRQVIQPVPLRVRWSSTGRPVAAARDVVFDDVTDADWSAIPLQGDVESVAAAFGELPYRQLVVLGEPGAGKTVLAMLLTLQLLKIWRSRPDKAVPVLFPIASWNPDAEQIEVFLARRLAEEYPSLSRRDDQGHRLADLLVEHARLLPVLDGLDELPAGRHTIAMEKLDLFAAQGPFAEKGRPLVVTCRTREYEQTVTRSGRVLSRAAVVEIEPVDVDQAIAFLSHPAPARSRWNPVFAHLRAHPDGPLAQVLSTPLMVSLARAAFQPQTSEPTALLSMSDRESIASKLLDGFLTGVYQSAPPGTSPRRRPGNYQPDQATRWLSCLASQLRQAGTRDLHWWQLAPGRPSPRPGRLRPQVPLAAAGGLVLLAALATAPVGAALAVRVATVAALIVGLNAGGMFRSMWPNTYPPQVLLTYHSSRRLRARRLRVRATFGALYGLAAALLLGDTALGLVGSLVHAACTAVMPTWTAPSRRRHSRRTSPRLTLRANHFAAAIAAVQYGLSGGVAFALTAAALPGPHSAANAAVITGTVCALAAAFAAGLWTWTRFRIAHLQLALRRQLPLRLWAFLDDAHRRGTLRQAGTVWQFRHAILQDHLANAVEISRLRVRADAGDNDAAWRLADLLAGQGRAADAIVFLRDLADAGDPDAVWQLTGLLTEQARIEDAVAFLEARAQHNGGYDAWRLADLLARQGNLEKLQGRADAGDGYASRQLARLLANQNQVEDAIVLLQTRADAGDGHAIRQLAKLLAEQGRIEDAIALFRTRADSGDGYAIRQLANLLAQQGRAEDAISLLRSRADAGDGYAVRQLANLLAQQGRTEEAIALFRARADTGDGYATRQLADLLARQDRIDDAITVLRTRADAGDGHAIRQLANLLAQQGRAEDAIDLLQTRVGNSDAAWQLAVLLAEQGRAEDAVAFLRTRADAGNSDAVWQLADLLVEQGRIEEAIAFLRKHANAGNTEAAWQLADLLAEQGRVEDAITFLRTRANAGDGYATRQLANLLASQNQVDDAITLLRTRANAGDRSAARQLAHLLNKAQ